MAPPPRTEYLVLEIAADRLIGAIAEEAALTDDGLDDLERQILDPHVEAERAAALALTLGRAGWSRSAETLSQLWTRLSAQGREVEANAAALAKALLMPRPDARIERADSGYRFSVPPGSDLLFVEDPLAAHWHALGRWGPPIRPDLDRPPVHASPDSEVEALAHVAADGGVVVVPFAAGWLRRAPEPPLRLTRAGLARDPALSNLVRWSRVSSLGMIEGRFQRHVAYQARGEAPVRLPARPSLPPPMLLDLMGRLLKQARS